MNDVETYLTDTVPAMIAAHGWVVQCVLPQTVGPSHHYTVGLWPVAGFELIVTGLPLGLGQRLLNVLAARVRDGERYRHGQLLTGVLLGYRAALLRVTSPGPWLTIADRLYAPAGERVPAWQVVYPDVEDHLPWESGYHLSGQPLLGPAPDHA
jgi:hypothetical protein